MTVLVALKFKDGVILGADRRVSSYYSKSREGINKIVNMKYSNSAIAITGYLADLAAIEKRGELVGYKDILDKVEIDLPYVRDKVTRTIYDIQVANHRIDPNKYPSMGESSYIFITEERIFEISCDFYAFEKSLYAVDGCGECPAEGYLEVELDGLKREDLTEELATEIVKNVIQKSCANMLGVGDGYDLCVLRKGE